MHLSDEAQAMKREYMAKWRSKNREKVNAYSREWRKENPEKVKGYYEDYWIRKAEEVISRREV